MYTPLGSIGAVPEQGPRVYLDSEKVLELDNWSMLEHIYGESRCLTKIIACRQKSSDK